MGVVFKQSLQNTIVTYIGFVIGAINTLVLYTRFMADADYGLVQVVLSVSAVLMPILSFGVPNALVKFFSSFERAEQDRFLNLMLVLPLVFIVPVALLSYLANEAIGNLLARENDVVRHYVWPIFFIGMAMAYFEVFYAWCRVYLRSVFGNFMKEIFCRIGQSVLLVLLYFDAIDVPFFLNALVGLYLFRTLIMKWYAFRLRFPVLSLALPKNTKTILTYSLLIILGGSTAMVLLEVDKVMLNNYLKIENVAYYGVAGFIAMTIAVPSRAMHQITYPLTAAYLNQKDQAALLDLYQRSSLTLFGISGWLFWSSSSIWMICTNCCHRVTAGAFSLCFGWGWPSCTMRCWATTIPFYIIPIITGAYWPWAYCWPLWPSCSICGSFPVLDSMGQPLPVFPPFLSIIP
jgi:O-antigen/teichoic acid export membrane protein